MAVASRVKEALNRGCRSARPWRLRPSGAGGQGEAGRGRPARRRAALRRHRRSALAAARASSAGGLAGGGGGAAAAIRRRPGWARTAARAPAGARVSPPAMRQPAPERSAADSRQRKLTVNSLAATACAQGVRQDCPVEVSPRRRPVRIRIAWWCAAGADFGSSKLCIQLGIPEHAGKTQTAGCDRDESFHDRIRPLVRPTAALHHSGADERCNRCPRARNTRGRAQRSDIRYRANVPRYGKNDLTWLLRVWARALRRLEPAPARPPAGRRSG